MPTEGRRVHIPVTSVAGRTGAVTLTVADVAGAEAAAGKGQPDGYAALGSDGKVPAAQLPPPAGGGGQPTRIPVTEYYSTWTAVTAGGDRGHMSHGVPLTESGTYRIKACMRVGAVTNTATLVELRSNTAQALVAVNAGDLTERTLFAANTQIAVWNKGTAIAAGDRFNLASADIALYAGEFIRTAGNGAPFQAKCDGSSAQVACSGTAIYLEKQS